LTAARQGGLLAVCGTGTAVLLAPGGAAVLLALLLLAILVLTCLATAATANGIVPAAPGGLVAVCATGTAVLVLAALTTVTIALAPQRVPLQTLPPPPNGGCETCDPNSLVIPPGLRHEYWVGLSITQENLPFYLALIAAPIVALFPAGLGAGLGEVSLRSRNRFDSARSPAPPAPSQTQVFRIGRRRGSS
jgi:hypothetical protein